MNFLSFGSFLHIGREPNTQHVDHVSNTAKSAKPNEDDDDDDCHSATSYDL